MRVFAAIIWGITALVCAVGFCLLVPIGLLNRAVGRRLWGDSW
jgi:hypothetical protein